ncbi:MAG: nucleotide sugar dehydrogenase [Bacteroidales bacterium]|nr:nucleotide sugar dehydrogenase [Bacteroidales bacterium]
MKNFNIGVIGLGYVGLPLAVEFAKKYPVAGFDIKPNRIDELNAGHDSTLEVEDDNLQSVLSKQLIQPGKTGMYLTDKVKDLGDCNYYIITVPTPIDKNRHPDLTPLIKASETVGKVISKGDVVIYESTVYPGATEEDCIPVIESTSGLKFNRDFYAGYSPERINPGDKVHTVTKIKKVTSGSTPEIAKEIDDLYKTVIEAGTHLASNIKVAEAAKVIENTQRDLNIAFVNELAVLFNRLGIDTLEVLEAAGTKWNFLPFRPGLVGGHCIGVDPYYLTFKAQEAGLNPETITAGRRLNDNMGIYIANNVIKLMIQKKQTIAHANVLVLGITFKENCPDIRNSKVIDVITELKDFGCNVDVFDPWANPEEVKKEYAIGLLSTIDRQEKSDHTYDAIILAVAHDKFRDVKFTNLKNGSTVLYDIKGFFDKQTVDGRL